MSILKEFKQINKVATYLGESDITRLLKYTENPIHVDDHAMFIYKENLYKKI